MAPSKWPTFIRQCFLRRTTGREFQELADLMYERFRIPGKAVVQVILDCGSSICVTGDPLIAVYLRIVITLGLAQPVDLLAVVIRKWNSSNVLVDGAKDPGLLAAENVIILNGLADLVASEDLSVDAEEVRKRMVFLSRWLIALSQWVSIDTTRMAIGSIMSLIEAIGVLLATTMSTDPGMASLNKSEPSTKDQTSSLEFQEDKEPRLSVRRAVDASLPLFSTVSAPLFHRFDALQKHFDLFDHSLDDTATNSAERMQLDAINFESNIIDGQVVHSGTALFVYLDAMLRTWKTVDDRRLLNFVNVRHTGNNETMFLELVIASFNVLINWETRQEPEASLLRCRHFLVNKLPSILAVISASSFGTFSSEAGLVNAIQQIFTICPKQVMVICKQFLQVCSLQQLVTIDAISTVFEDSPMETLPSRGSLQREEILGQLKSNAQRAGKIAEEMLKLEGNSGTIANAMVEETSALKEIANAIIRQPAAIDVISLFIRPAIVLSPLCTLLNEWNWDDLHGESQPVYDEFSSVLLLIQTFKYRLDLRNSELGISRVSNFVARYFEQMNGENNLVNLTETMQKHLGEWINALFIAEGLDDEITSACSPQEFYLLVPTILHQSMVAYESGKMSFETLRSGFEYLLEPFLLPSLIPALFWLISHAQRLHSTKLIARVLQILMKAPESPEAKEIHRTIWNIAALPLKHALEPESATIAEVRPIIKSMQSLQPFSSTLSPSTADIETWMALPGGILSRIQDTIRTLLFWSSSGGQPPSYTYLQLEAAIQIYGAASVLTSLAQELALLSGSPDYEVVLDIVTAMICAADPRSSLGLLDALRQQYRQLTDLLKKKNETALAEAVVRLHRRAELLRHVPEVLPNDTATSFVPNMVDMDMQDVATDSHELDVSALGGIPDQSQDIDDVLGVAAAMGDLEQGSLTGDMDDPYGVQDSMEMVNFNDFDIDGMF